MTKEIRNIYKDMGVNCNSVLIFGDTIQRPWTLTFDRVYINERINNCSRYTADVIEKCLALSEPPLTTVQYQTLQDLIAKYVAGENPPQNAVEKKNRQSIPDGCGDMIYTVEEHLLKQTAKGDSTSHNVEGDAKYGIWSECGGKNEGWFCGIRGIIADFSFQTKLIGPLYRWVDFPGNKEAYIILRKRTNIYDYNKIKKNNNFNQKPFYHGNSLFQQFFFYKNIFKFKTSRFSVASVSQSQILDIKFKAAVS